MFTLLLFSNDPLVISMAHYYLLLAHWPILWYTTILSGPLAVPMVHYYLLRILSFYTTIFYWLTCCLYGHYNFYWFTGPPSGTFLSSIGPLPISIVYYHLLLAHWLSLWYTTIFLLAQWLSLWYTTVFYRPTGYLYDTLPYSSDTLSISLIHFYFLLAHWLSLWYTTVFYWLTGYLYGHYYSLLAHWLSLWYIIIFFWVSGYVVHYYFLLAHWLSLWYTSIFYWPTGPPFVILPSSIAHWHTGPPYGTLLSSTGTLTIPMVHLVSSTGTLAITMVHYHLLLSHWLSLCNTTFFYWPTGPLCDTHPSSIGPLALPVVHYHLLLAHWAYLWSATIFSWPSGPSYGTLPFSNGPLAVCGTLLSSTGLLAVIMVHYHL